MRMVEFFHYFQFSFNRLAAIWLQQFNFLINLYCNFLIQNFMKTQPYDCISSLTNPFTDNVVIKIVNSATCSTKLQIFRSRRSLHLVNLGFVKRMPFYFNYRLLLHNLLNMFIFVILLASFSARLSCLGWLANLTLIKL